MLRHRSEERCRKMRKRAARLRISDMDRAFDGGLRPRDYRNSASLNRSRNEIFAIYARTLKRAEHRAGRNFAIIDSKAGDLRVTAFRKRNARRTCQCPQPHHSFSGTKRSRSVRSTSRELSGRTPSNGPIRGTRRPTIGAAVQPAVRWNELATVPRGSSSMATTT